MKIFAFHGFGTNAKTSNFCRQVEEHYSQHGIDVHCPEYNYLTTNPVDDFNSVKEQIEDLYVEGEETYFYGISLGGFVARYFAHTYDTGAALFNPSVFPWEDVKRYVTRAPLINNIPFANAIVKRIVRSAYMCEQFFCDTHLEKQAVVLTRDDKILEWNTSYNFFKDHAHIHIHDTGGHAMEIDDVLPTSLKHLDENWLHDKEDKEESHKEESFAESR